MRIFGRELGDGNPPLLVAEISANHLGDLNLALRTIRAAARAGADAVKLQTYTADALTIDSRKEDFLIKGGTIWDGRSLYELYREAFTPWEWHARLFEEARELGIGCFSTAFDRTAVDFLEELGTPLHKVASFEITDVPLIEYMASRGKPMIISTGIATLSEIEEAIGACRRVGNGQVILLKCVSAYPTPLEEANVRHIATLRETFGLPVGLSDHTLGQVVPVLSVAYGAVLIEKHFVLDRSLGGPDADFSMEPDEFAAMARAVREAFKALGERRYGLTERQMRSRSFARSLYVVKDVRAGEFFTEENVRSIRPGYGLHPRFLPLVLGRRARVDVEAGTPLSWDLVC